MRLCGRGPQPQSPTPRRPNTQASDRLRVGNWEVSYPELPAQFALAGIDPAGPNHWNKVYDFSPNPEGKQHWSFLPDQARQSTCHTPCHTPCLTPCHTPCLTPCHMPCT